MKVPWFIRRKVYGRADAPLRVVIAGGGTGGHVFPGIAIAEAFVSRNSLNRILFVGTGNRFEQLAFSNTPFPHVAIPAEGIKGRGIWQKIRAIAKLPLGMVLGIRILRRFGAQLVIGVGGYSSAPVVMGAYLMRIPIILQEQNLIPGMTNRLVGRLARRIHVSFDQTVSGFETRKIRVSGNPVREAFSSVMPDSNAVKRERFTVMICGGSQGAHAINRSVMDALPQLGDKQRLFFIHQTGGADEEAVRSAYASHGISAEVAAFFTDMAVQYRRSDLIICRAGATTVAELTALGKPAIFVPYPHAADQHQRLNAEMLMEAGAAEMLPENEMSGKILAERISRYQINPGLLARMAAKSRELGRPNAAADIVADCYGLLFDNPFDSRLKTD